MSTVASILSGKTRALDGKAAAGDVVSATDAADPLKLARLLTKLGRAVADLSRRFAPHFVDFEDLPVGSSSTHRLAHGFGGRVRWWVVDADGVPALTKDPATDANTLVLTSTVACTVTVRIEEIG